MATSVDAIARPIHGAAELDTIADEVGDKRFVLLGEASHGTHEFYDLRAAITRRLVTHHGFTAVLVEGDWPDALRVDRYTRGSDADETAEQALAGFARFPKWMWRNRDVASFVEWAHRRGACGFYGLDLYSLHASISALLAYLDDNDPEAAVRARQRFACFDHAAADPQQYGLEASLGIGPRCEAEVVAQLVDMLGRKLGRSGRSPVGDAWFHAAQQAHVVRDAEAYYRAMFAGRHAAWNLRDTHMADTLDFVAGHLGADAKVVVWAHNSHVGDGRATELGEGGEITLGQLVRQRHPGETALVGFTTYEGRVLAASDWDEPAREQAVPPALEGSWEELLHAVELPRFYVRGRELEPAELLQRAIGVVYRPDTERESHYFYANLAEEFDLVIHVDATRALEPLDPSVPAAPAPPEPELPETFPTGM